MMARFLIAASAVLVLSACATAIETPTQDLTIQLIGTGEALCDVRQKNYRYRAYAPGSIRVQKANEPMHIRCEAPGNRQLTTTLDPEVSKTVMANVTNGVVPGMAWDYFSGAMYKYPDRVVMDFSAMPPQPYELPDYQKVFARNPALQSMEEFRPGIAALQSDIGRPVQGLPPREVAVVAEESVPGTMFVETLESTSVPAPSAPIPDAGMSAEGLTRMMNPHVFTPQD